MTEALYLDLEDIKQTKSEGKEKKKKKERKKKKEKKILLPS